MKMALRTQQIIAEESGVADVIDPLGGSYYVEALTTEYEKKIFEILEEVEKRGGTIKPIEQAGSRSRLRTSLTRPRCASSPARSR